MRELQIDFVKLLTRMGGSQLPPFVHEGLSATVAPMFVQPGKHVVNVRIVPIRESTPDVFKVPSSNAFIVV